VRGGRLAAAVHRLDRTGRGRAAGELHPDAGVRRVGRRGRPRARRARAADRRCAAGPACTCPAPVACARAALARVPLLCARCARAAMLSKPPDLLRWWLRTHDAAFRARDHARSADTQRGHACTRRRASRARTLRADHNRHDAIVLLVTMLLCCLRCAELPCVRKRCVCLRAVFGCAVLVQALEHVQLPVAPCALVACAQTTTATMLLRCLLCLRCAELPCAASAARACALRLCALCLCRYSHTCSSSSRCVLRSPTSSTSRGACIHRVVLVDVATHIPCRPRRHGSTKCDAYACDAHARCGDWQNEMRCTCMLVACTPSLAFPPPICMHSAP